MVGFSDRYTKYDDIIFNKLGDDVELLLADGDWITIKVPFEWDHNEGLIEDRSHDTIPMLTDILPTHIHLFDDFGSLVVRYRNVTYSVLDVFPKDDKTHTAILRQRRIGS